MKKPALTIDKLAIYKMPGFPKGMETLKDLAQHINVIAGPNASGKSSTARTIQDVIWKQNMDKIHVHSSISIQDKSWQITIDNGFYNSQSNGVDEALPSIPAADESKRYFLALHELIKENDQNLAAEIWRETIGGYDLQKAQETLGFKSSTPNRGISSYKNVENQERLVAEIERNQSELKNEERKLTTLYEAYEKSKKANQFKQFYEYVAAYLEAKSEFEYLQKEKSAYPPQMSKLRGQENSNLSKLEEEVEINRQKIDSVNREIGQKNESLKALQLPENGFEQLLLNELHENIEKLAKLEGELERRRVEIEKNERGTKVVLQHLFSNLNQENLNQLNLANIFDLDRFFEKAHQLLVEKQHLKQEIERLKQHQQSQEFTEEKLHHGIRILLNWYETEGKSKESSKKPLWILLVLSALTVVATYFLGWWGFIGLLLILLYILMYKSPSATDHLRQTRESDFKKIGLSSPNKWEETEVSKKLAELHQQLIDAKQQQDINRRLKTLHDSLDEIQPALQSLENERQHWLHKLSDIPTLELENIASYSGLYWFLKDLQEWQKHHNELQAALAAQQEEIKIYEETLSHINAILGTVQVKTVSNVTAAKATLKHMNESENHRVALLREIKNLDNQQLFYQDLISKSKNDIQAIYDQIDLDLNDKEQLQVLLTQKEAFDHLEKELEQAKRRFNEKEHQIQEHSFWNERKKECSILSIDEAKMRQERYELQAEKAEELYTEIAQIEAHINKEKTGHALEDALAKKEMALDELEDYYQQNISSITGDIILQGLKKKTQEHSSSKVFNRANSLFNQITHGQYELILDEDQGGSFRAKDTILNQGLPLDHLSSGTRIQLLIAVRLAFIESQESSVKLPIIADEVLANSDDLRAQQIIEALIEISKEGRQVFYFTAQTDELKKWEEHLAQHPDIEGKTFVLQGQRNIDYEQNIQDTAFDFSMRFNEVIAPENHTYESYRQLLNPPKYDLLKDQPEQLHLAYLIADNALLYACLQRGIPAYGALKSYHQHQGEINGLTADMFHEMEEKALLLEHFQRLYKKGRSQSIDRSILQKSGAVSDTFIDAVTTTLIEVDYDPERLLQALKAGEVARFQTAKITELESYLFDHRYIDDEEPLTAEEIKLKLHATLSQMDLSAEDADLFLKRVMS